jgi:carboxyl-terminal processing protease
MLVDLEKRFKDLDKQTEISLLESKRRAEFEKREEERLLHKNRFRTSQGLKAIEQEEDLENRDDDDEEGKAARRIELNEAARILVDSIRLHAPMAVMR